jgi:hypothetical protein
MNTPFPVIIRVIPHWSWMESVHFADFLFLRSEVLTEVTMCSLVEVSRRFGGTHCYHLLYFFSLLLDRNYGYSNCSETSANFVTSQKTVLHRLSNSRKLVLRVESGLRPASLSRHTLVQQHNHFDSPLLTTVKVCALDLRIITLLISQIPSVHRREWHRRVAESWRHYFAPRLC